jgi:hypothetical protein
MWTWRSLSRFIRNIFCSKSLSKFWSFDWKKLDLLYPWSSAPGHRISNQISLNSVGTDEIRLEIRWPGALELGIKIFYFLCILQRIFLLGTLFCLLFLLEIVLLIRTKSINRKILRINWLFFKIIEWFLHHSM